MFTKDIKNLSTEIEDKIISIRRTIHKHPELGFKEHQTSQFISNYLSSLGLKVKTNLAVTGLTGLLEGSKPGKTIAIRADMDALPIKEQNTFDYVSQHSGVMHACGHDAHVAIALGTAEVLSKMKDKIQGNIKFIFQPAEEGLGGAKYMVDEGVLKSPDVDAIIAAHVSPELESGSISLRSGPLMASPSEFEIVVKGRGGHAAQPHLVVDPIPIAANLVNVFQTLISRELSPFEEAVLSITYFNAGSNYNIIPDTATLRGTVRTFDPQINQTIAKRMEEITRGITTSMGAQYSFHYSIGYPPVVNHGAIVETIKEASLKIIDESSVITNAAPCMLAEDFSYYINRIPGALYFIGCANTALGINYNLHSDKFTIDESCLKTGVRIMSQTAMDWLDKNV